MSSSVASVAYFWLDLAYLNVGQPIFFFFQITYRTFAIPSGLFVEYFQIVIVLNIAQYRGHGQSILSANSLL